MSLSLHKIADIRSTIQKLKDILLTIQPANPEDYIQVALNKLQSDYPTHPVWEGEEVKIKQPLGRIRRTSNRNAKNNYEEEETVLTKTLSLPRFVLTPNIDPKPIKKDVNLVPTAFSVTNFGDMHLQVNNNANWLSAIKWEDDDDKSSSDTSPMAIKKQLSSRKILQSQLDVLTKERDQARTQVDTLLDFACCLNELKIKVLVRNIMSKARDALQADRCTLFLLDNESQELVSFVADGTNTIRIPSTAGIAGSCATNKTTINITDAYSDSRFNRSVDMQTGYHTQTILCMPIMPKKRSGECDTPLGVVQMINKKNGVFTNDDEKLLSGLTIQAAVAIQNSQMYEQTKSMQIHYETILRAIPDTVITLDSEGQMKFSNHDTKDLFGLKESTLKTSSYLSWWGNNDINRKVVQDIEDVYINKRKRHSLDVKMTNYNSNTTKTVNYQIIPMYFKNNNNLTVNEMENDGVVWVIEDITKEKQMLDTLDKYVSHNVAAHILSMEGGPKLGGERLKATILFVDIRSFTTLTEPMQPEDVVFMLNDFFKCIGRAISEEGGTVDKYIGDCAMAVFGVPIPNIDDTYRACKAALKIQEYVSQLNAARLEINEPEINFGIGINTSTVLAGNIGSDNRLEYTVIGDGVNTASRVEGITKVFGLKILCTDSTFDEVGDSFITREVDCVRLVGKKLPVTLYEIIALKDFKLSNTKQQSLRLYNEAYEYYKIGDWDNAIKKWTNSSDLEDMPSMAMLQRCQQFKIKNPTNWDGIWSFKSK